MKNTWSITESIFLYHSYDGKKVFIANPETKKFYGPVKKISESVKDPEMVKNDGHDIKFCDEKLKINLGGTWKEIGNVMKIDIISQLSGTNMNNGEISGVIFGFKPRYPEYTLPLFPGSEYLKDAEKEFIRKINLTLYQKTTKYIPGHKYESENGTYLYLGEVYTHLSDKNRSKRYTTTANGVRTLYAFTNDFEGINNVEEIYTTFNIIELSSYPEDTLEKKIFLMDKKKTMADLGEVIKINPAFKPESVWEKRIQYFMGIKEEYSKFSSLYRYSNINGLFEGFNISSDLLPVVSDASKNMIKNLLKNEFRYILYKYYDLTIHRREFNILSKNTIQEQATSLSKYFFYKDLYSLNNCYYSEYYTEMIKVLFGIDILKLGEESIEEYKLLTISTLDFQDLIENFGYLEFRLPEIYAKDIDFVYTKDEKRDFENFIGTGLYKNTIKDIYTRAIDDNGSELKDFNVTNVGTVKNPLLEYQMSIDLDDLIKYFGVKTIYDLPEDFKKEMVDKKIYKVMIRTRDGIKIK